MTYNVFDGTLNLAQSINQTQKNAWWGQPLLPKILGQDDPVGAKSPIFSRYSLVAPQR